MRQLIRSIVADVRPLDPEEATHRADVIEWIDSGVDLFRTAKPATPSKHLVSYCVLVDTDTQRVLLVDHRDAQRWLPTGGHVESDEHPATAASREIQEELGITPTFHPAMGDAPAMVTVTQTAGVSASHTDVSLWFAFSGSEQLALDSDDGEFVDTRWWGFDEVEHGAGTRFDPHLPRFIQKLTAATT